MKSRCGSGMSVRDVMMNIWLGQARRVGRQPFVVLLPRSGQKASPPHSSSPIAVASYYGCLSPGLNSYSRNTSVFFQIRRFKIIYLLFHQRLTRRKAILRSLIAQHRCMEILAQSQCMLHSRDIPEMPPRPQVPRRRTPRSTAADVQPCNSSGELQISAPLHLPHGILLGQRDHRGMEERQWR